MELLANSSRVNHNLGPEFSIVLSHVNTDLYKCGALLFSMESCISEECGRTILGCVISPKAIAAVVNVTCCVSPHNFVLKVNNEDSYITLK